MPSFAQGKPLERPLHVGALAQQKMAGGVQISAVVSGKRMWFESDDADLVPSPEAFGSAMLIPAMHVNRAMAIDQEVCSVWADNLRQVMEVASRWWSYSQLEPQVVPVVQNRMPCTSIALCFSGGVDSFYSLLRGPGPLHLLVSAIGYDMKLSDATRIAMVKSSVRAVAAEMGLRAVFVTSNIRQHAAFRAVAWERSHGGALAALGHLLSGQVGRLKISASCAQADDIPWGSRWDIDPFFSSSVLAIDHVGADLWRIEKLRAIAHEDVVRRHLRVCWENRNSEANCCQCEKCVRTMLVLETCGQLEKYPRFQGGRGLADKVERLPCLPRVLIPAYQLFLTSGLTDNCDAAVRRLLARSLEQRPPLFVRAKKWIRNKLSS